MNPEEGDLRPQLLDRFAFSVTVGGLTDTRQRVQIMERRLAFEHDPEQFCAEWAPYEQALSEQIAAARDLVSQVSWSRRDLAAVAILTGQYKVDGHRGDIVILRGAQANAALHGRRRITDEDIVLAAELALPHRIKGRLMQDAAISAENLEGLLHNMAADWNSESEDGPPDPTESDQSADQKKKPSTLTRR
jgi:Mg-chelatase subunit ChlI